jgi:phosphonate transport system substrate-binding protein
MWNALNRFEWQGLSKKSIGKWLLGSLIFSLMLPCFAQKANSKIYTLAVVPQYSPAELQNDWNPIIERIKQTTGIELQLKLSPSIPLFEASFLRGEADFAFVNPYHCVMAKQAQSYIPLIRNQDTITGVLLVLKNSPIQNLKDLANTKIGFPAPNSFAASLLMRAHLNKQHIPFTAEYLKSHSNVYRNLIAGFISAAGGVSTTYNDEDPKIRDQFRILYQTPETASHPIIAHPRVPEAVRTAITQAFLSLAKDSVGQNLLKQIRIPLPTKANYEQDYRPLEKLDIEKFVVLD